MLGWMARRELFQPTIESLRGDDFESIWGLSFRWCNREVPSEGLTEVPDDVRQMTYRIIRGFFKGEITLRRTNGYKVDREPFYLVVVDINPWRKVLWRCLSTGSFEMSYLSKLYVERAQFLGWCESQQLFPPSFWAKGVAREAGGSKKFPLENRLRNDEVDRVVCQAIARVYWEIDPNIHPSHLAASRAINRYGNGKIYRDDSTIKGWIAEVDPRKGTRKSGRPEKIPYRIDLETGGLVELAQEN